ncbi:plasmid mobilization relaxosome protein MobC [Nocardia niigatensis]
MDAQEVSGSGSTNGRRSAQNVARARRRRRRPNIDGPKHKPEIVFSDEEFARVQKFADEANCTLPWYVVQAAAYPVPGGSSGEKSGPWLPWAQRREIVAQLGSAASALDMMRRHHVKKIGGNLNQLVHSAHIDGELSEEIWEVLEELEAVAEELRERAERIEGYARDAARR